MNWSRFETYLTEKMKDENIAGVAVAVSKNGETIYKKGFGYRDIKTKKPVTPDTIFGIASITKSFTALAIIMLEEEGLLSIDDPVIKYIPEFKVKGINNMEDIKIYHLLSHTTGLAPLERKEELNKLNEHLRYFASENHELLGKPGRYFSYCNDAFILLGAIIERLTGKLYRRHITDVILNRLEMLRSTMSIEELEKMNNVSVPYNHNKDKELEEKPWPKLGNYEVGGGVRSTVLDLLKYGALYLNDKRFNKLWKNPFKIQEGNYYGYALKVTPDYNGVTLVEHGGSQPGVSSNFGFIPEEGVVVSVLCNVSGINASDIWLKAVNTVLECSFDKKRVIYPRGEIMKELDTYCGTYRSLEGTSIEIKKEENQLKLITEEEQYTLRGCKEDTLVIEEKERPIYFYFKDNDVAWAVLYGSRMLTKKEEF